MFESVKQVLAALIVGQEVMALGLNFGLNSVTLIQVPEQADRFMNDDQLNWTIAVGHLGALLGCLLAMPLAPRLGTKRLLMLAMPMHALASLMVGLGGHFVWVLAGRVLMNVAIGLSEGSARGYVSEIVPPHRRALFTAFVNALLFSGLLLGLAFAPFMRWQTLFIVAGFGPAAVSVCGLLFLPNSPKWLLAHGHSVEEALHAIRFYHGNETDAEAEVRSVQESLQLAKDDGMGKRNVWTLLQERVTLRPLLLAAGQMVLFAWCGGPSLVLITALILSPVKLPLNAYQSAMLPPSLVLLFVVPVNVLVERYGRLPMLRLSGALTSLGCATIAAYFFLSDELQARLGWMALAGAAVTQFSSSCITSTITFNYATELLPNRTRAIGAYIAIFVLNLSQFILLKVYPLITGAIGLGGAFAIHAAVGLCQVAYASLCLVETKRLSLEQIQMLFQNTEKIAELTVHVAELGKDGTQTLRMKDARSLEGTAM